jgi:thiamine kinase-like enzyme
VLQSPGIFGHGICCRENFRTSTGSKFQEQVTGNSKSLQRNPEMRCWTTRWRPRSGLLWAECGDFSPFSPTTIDDIERCLNRRLSTGNPSELDLKQQHDLVFCHLDLADRTLLFLDDGSIAILDWASAGFYPQLLEICTLFLNTTKEEDLAGFLLKSSLSSQGERDVNLVLEAWGNSQRYW